MWDYAISILSCNYSISILSGRNVVIIRRRGLVNVHGSGTEIIADTTVLEYVEACCRLQS
jgi:hypothetical protein